MDVEAASEEAISRLLPSSRGETAPTMGVLRKLRYSHDAMIDALIADPTLSQNQLGAIFGVTPGWVSNIMASDAWKSKMAARREELVDPALRATLDDKYRGLALRSVEVLMGKLDQPQVSDNLALRAFELGAKAIGAGGNAPPPVPAADRLAQLANRLIDLQANVRKGVTIEQVSEVG